MGFGKMLALRRRHPCRQRNHSAKQGFIFDDMKLSNPPGPKRMFPGQFFFRFQKDPIAFLTEIAREHGDLSQFKIGPQYFFFLNHPDLIRDVLVTHDRNFLKGRALERAKRLLGEGLLTSEGEFHLRQRRMIQPVFHRGKISNYAAVMQKHSEALSFRWMDGQILDMHEEMMELTLTIVAETLFHTDVAGEAEEIGHALSSLVEQFNILMLPYSEFIERLPIPRMIRVRKAIERLDRTVYRMIDERRNSSEQKNDLLSMLLHSVDEENPDRRMTDQQIRDEAMTIFLAGHETTANALTWTWYLLSQNPEVETKLHAELEAVLHCGSPSFDDLQRLPYLMNVISESMRLYPPAWVIGRRAIEDYYARDFLIPAGSIVAMSQYVMHRDPRYYPDPEKFDPERWSPEARAQRPKFSYFPFGAGSRICIGEHFAWMEATLILAILCQKWNARLIPKHPVELRPTITLRPKHGMKMILGKRKSLAAA
jgi:cytochrome P450